VTRRLDIGPLVLALGAIVVLVGLFLRWYGEFNAWDVFELVDLLLAALAVAAIVGAVGLLMPDVDLLGSRALPWLAGALVVLVVAQLLDRPPAAVELPLGTGAWLAFAGAVLAAIGTLLSLGRVSFAISIEGRDRRRRVAAVDHRPPPTETGAPVARSSEPLLQPRPDPEAGETS
jgi:hypothetical protein